MKGEEEEGKRFKGALGGIRGEGGRTEIGG